MFQIKNILRLEKLIYFLPISQNAIITAISTQYLRIILILKVSFRINNSKGDDMSIWQISESKLKTSFEGTLVYIVSKL